MKELYPHIYHTLDPPTAEDTNHRRAYLVARPGGNLLFHSSPTIEAEFDAIRAQGGLSAQYLGDRGEVSAGCARLRDAFGAPLSCHALELPAISVLCQVDAYFNKRHQTGDGLEVIPTPGHYPGSTCFLWHLSGRNYLFSGGTLFPCDGSWNTDISHPESDKGSMIASLELLRGLPVDVILPGRFQGSLNFEAVSPERWQAIIDGCLCRLG